MTATPTKLFAKDNEEGPATTRLRVRYVAHDNRNDKRLDQQQKMALPPKGYNINILQERRPTSAFPCEKTVCKKSLVILSRCDWNYIIHDGNYKERTLAKNKPHKAPINKEMGA